MPLTHDGDSWYRSSNARKRLHGCKFSKHPCYSSSCLPLYQLAFRKPATYFVSVQMNQLMFDYFELLCKSPHHRPSHPRKDQCQSETSFEATKDYWASTTVHRVHLKDPSDSVELCEFCSNYCHWTLSSKLCFDNQTTCRSFTDIADRWARLDCDHL